MPSSVTTMLTFLVLAAALCLAFSAVAPLHVHAQQEEASPPADAATSLLVDPFVVSASPEGSSTAYPPDIAWTTGGALPPGVAYDYFLGGAAGGAPGPAVVNYFSGGKGGGALPPGAVEKGGNGGASAPSIGGSGSSGGVGESPDIPIVVIDDGGFLPGPTPSDAIADSPNVVEEVDDPVPQEGTAGSPEGSSPPPPSPPFVVIDNPGSTSAPAPAPVTVIVENDGEEQAAAIEAFLKEKANGYYLLYTALKKIDFFSTLASGISAGNKYTIIAPIDKGFKIFKIRKLKIADVLAGHVITTGKLKYDAVFAAAADTALNTLLGTKVYKAAKLKKVKKVLRPRLLTKKANGKKSSLATVIVPDAFETTNAVVHGISKVLRPSFAQPSKR